MEDSFTLNAYLDGKVMIKQPTQGYRAGLDAVMAAAALSPQDGQTVLDVGCGVGTIMLCCAWRHPKAHFTGIEAQPTLAQLAHDNIIHNKRADTCRVIEENILTSQTLSPQSFDHVISNPPYYKEKSARKSPFETKSKAHVEEAPLHDWIKFCVKMLKPRGTLTLIYPTDRLDELLHHLYTHVGEIQILPLRPKENQPAKRVLLKARKQIQAGLTLLPGLVLHDADGNTPPAVQKILRDGESVF